MMIIIVVIPRIMMLAGGVGMATVAMIAVIGAGIGMAIAMTIIGHRRPFPITTITVRHRRLLSTIMGRIMGRRRSTGMAVMNGDDNGCRNSMP